VRYLVALVTVPDLRTGRRLSDLVLRRRLAACANLVPGLESRYWWKGRLEKASEALLLLKTAASKVRALERCVREALPAMDRRELEGPEAVGPPMRRFPA
jgi:periplasmic divalent cation tolerance protein